MTLKVSGRKKEECGMWEEAMERRRMRRWRGKSRKKGRRKRRNDEKPN
jgi:hypothetical protein